MLHKRNTSDNMSKESTINSKNEIDELKKENKSLKETVAGLIKKVNELQSFEPADRTGLTSEQQIIEDQIEYYRDMSMQRPLSLEETRAVDLLIKNKRLLSNKKDEEDPNEVPDGQTESDLLRIASNVVPIENAGSKSKPS